jgi:DNA-binding NarL/FixJ family response regulator
MRATEKASKAAAGIRVAIVEDQARLRDGLSALIAATPEFAVVGSFGSMEEAIDGLGRASAQVLLADIGLPGMSGIDGVRRLKTTHPELQILMLTVYNDNDHIFEAICAGACGYLLKDTPPSQLLESIRELHAGGAPMSPDVARKAITMFQKIAPPRDVEHNLSARELEVVHLLAEGRSYKMIADAMSVSIDTVRFHIRNIYEKLHVHSKSEAVIAALRRGIVR